MNGLAAAAVIRTLFSSFTHPCECAFCAWMCVFVCAFLCCRWMSLRVFFCTQVPVWKEKEGKKVCENMWRKMESVWKKKKKRKRKGSEDGASRIWFIRASSRIPLHLSPVFFPPTESSSHYIFFTCFSARSFPIHFTSQIRNPPLLHLLRSSHSNASLLPSDTCLVPHLPSFLLFLSSILVSSVHLFLLVKIWFCRDGIYLQLRSGQIWAVAQTASWLCVSCKHTWICVLSGFFEGVA